MGIGYLFNPCVNAVDWWRFLTVMYGGELLYLRIWGNLSAGSVHIIITACFAAQ